MSKLIETGPNIIYEPFERSKGCAISANNDREAINSWLSEFKSSPNTFKSYQKETKKLYIWANYEVKKPLSELKKEDFEQYIRFLSHPPRAWVVSKQNPKAPFSSNNQSFKAVQYNIRVINALLNYLFEAEYLYKNPLRLIKQFSKFKLMEDRALSVKSKILEDHEFEVVLQVLDSLPQDTYKALDRKIKIKVIFAMLYHLGLRVTELSNALWDNFKMVQGQCWYHVVGKGNKLAQIPVNDELLKLIKNYRQHLGLTPEVAQFESDWVLKSTKTNKNLSARRIRELVKEIFMQAAEHFDEPRVKEKIQKASPHDLRHLLASDLDKRGVSMVDSKAILRHESERTTEIYRHSKERQRHQMMQDNAVGMTMDVPEKIEKLTLVVNCRPQDKLGFSYFMQSLYDIYLKPYITVKLAPIKDVMQCYEDKQRVYGSLNLSINLSKSRGNINALMDKMLDAAKARNLQLSIKYEDKVYQI